MWILHRLILCATWCEWLLVIHMENKWNLLMSVFHWLALALVKAVKQAGAVFPLSRWQSVDGWNRSSVTRLHCRHVRVSDNKQIHNISTASVEHCQKLDRTLITCFHSKTYWSNVKKANDGDYVIVSSQKLTWKSHNVGQWCEQL